jgi:hypothetical protein
MHGVTGNRSAGAAYVGALKGAASGAADTAAGHQRTRSESLEGLPPAKRQNSSSADSTGMGPRGAGLLDMPSQVLTKIIEDTQARDEDDPQPTPNYETTIRLTRTSRQLRSHVGQMAQEVLNERIPNLIGNLELQNVLYTLVTLLPRQDRSAALLAIKARIHSFVADGPPAITGPNLDADKDSAMGLIAMGANDLSVAHRGPELHAFVEQMREAEEADSQEAFALLQEFIAEHSTGN